MFTANNVTLRFLEFDDIDTLYSWETDIELAIWSGWIPPLSRAAFRHRYEQRITEPDKDLVMLGIEFEGQLALTVCRRKKNTKDEVLPHILHLSTCQDKQVAYQSMS